MKIILIYTPRSGSTSILKYFSKVNPEYECFNEPWFSWMIENVHHQTLNYDEVILKENVFIKSTYKNLPLPLDKIIKDFDKVIFLLRKNIQEQIESSIITHSNESFLSYSKQKYWIDNIDEEELEITRERFKFLNTTLIAASVRYNKPLFFYEDLYYHDFTPLFDELGIDIHPQYFKEYLDRSNRYREGIVEGKKIKSFI